jgi:hypothetical protein
MIPSVKKNIPHCLMVKPIFKQHFFMVNSPQKNRWNHQQLRHYREAISYALYKRFPTARSLLVDALEFSGEFFGDFHGFPLNFFGVSRMFVGFSG